MSQDTEAVLRRHLEAAGQGVDAIMSDYVDASVLVTRQAAHRGPAEIRRFFTDLLEGETKDFIGAFEMERQEVAGELAYIVWRAEPWFAFATDTFVVRNGKIVLQTFAAQTASTQSIGVARGAHHPPEK